MNKLLFDLPFYVSDPLDCARAICEKIRLSRYGVSVLPTSMNDIYWQDIDKKYRKVLKSFDYLVPDGMPLVWLLRKKGFQQTKRIYGPDLMLDICKYSVKPGLSHFFYGGDNDLLKALTQRLEKDYPGIVIAGCYAPPYRALNAQEETSLMSELEKQQPDIIWVGVGSPKQVYFIKQWREKYPYAAYLAVGASFDFHSGRRAQAPRLLQRNGLEWLFRLMVEPKRLYRRYVGQMPRMLWLFLREYFK